MNVPSIIMQLTYSKTNRADELNLGLHRALLARAEESSHDLHYPIHHAWIAFNAIRQRIVTERTAGPYRFYHLYQ